MPTLKKQERLYEQSLIETLFSKGKSLFVGDKQAALRVRYLFIDAAASCEAVPAEAAPANVQNPYPACKLMVSASKRNYKHAVTRNRLKRLLREAFRAHKDVFFALAPQGKTLLLSLQFTGEPKVKLAETEALVARLLKKMQHD